MVRQYHIHCLKRSCHTPCRGHILLGWQSEPTGMIVCQNHGSRFRRKCNLHNASDGDSGRIDAALSHHAAADHLSLRIQAKQKYRFIASAKKIRQQILTAGFRRKQRLTLQLCLVHLI